MASFALVTRARRRSSSLTAAADDFQNAVAGATGAQVDNELIARPRPGTRASRSADIILVFDGGSRGNPGQGYGSFTYKGRVVRWPTSLSFPGRITNNQAEYMTLIGGIRAILYDLNQTAQTPGELTLEIRSDSRLVVEQVSGNWKIKNAELKRLHRQVIDLLAGFKRVSVVWHPRSESVRILGH